MPEYKWNKSEKGILKRMLRGLNAVDAIKEQRFVEGILGLLFWGAIILVICGSVYGCVQDRKKENCVHENFNKEVIKYDYDNSRIITECDFCGKEMYLSAEVSARVYEEATCTKKGLREEYWKVIDYSYLDTNFMAEIPCKPHNYKEIKEALEPSCAGPGNTPVLECIDCGDTIGGQILSNDGYRHNEKYVPPIEPTCISVGYNGYFVCLDCGNIDHEIREIPMIDHNYQPTVIAPTNTTSGYTYYTCSMCNDTYIDSSSYIEPLISNIINYRVVLDALNINNGEDYIVVEGPKEGVSEVIIPSEIDGYKVLKIEGPLNYEYDVVGKYFSSNETITKIVLPDTLHTIEQYAFYNCKNLEEINLPSNLKKLGQYAFSDCASLENVIIPGSVREISAHAFSDCKSLKNVKILDGTTHIDGYAFGGCSNLMSVILPDSMSIVERNSFSDCDKILVVRDINNCYNYWPSSVMYKIEGYDTNFLTYDDSLFIYDDSKDKYLLLECNKTGSNIIMPDDVNGKAYEIVDGALANLTDVSSITLKTINSYHFKNLFNGVIPSTLEEIIIDTEELVKENYFSNIKSLKKVVFAEKTVNVRYCLAGCSNIEEIIIYKETAGTVKGLFYDGSYSGISVPNSFKKVTIYDMEVMEEDYFYGCKGLVEINLPNNLKHIKEGAFEYCSSLEKIILPESLEKLDNYAFDNCTSLIEVYNLSNLDITKEDLNRYNLKLNVKIVYNSLDETSEIVEIGDFVFFGVSNQYELIAYKGNETTLELPNNVNGYGYSIAGDVFKDNNTLVSIVIPECVSFIAAESFSGCGNLESVVVNGNVTEIINSTYYNCNKLKSVTYSKNVTSVGEKAFYLCYELNNLMIGNEISEVGPYAFYSCKKLTNVSLSDGMESINPYSFYQCKKLESIYLSDNITEIGEYAFYECSSLTKLELPDSLKLIDEYAFSKCSNLSDVTFNEGLEEIMSRAFEECGQISKLIFKDGLLRIYGYAFSKCNNVSEIYLPSSVIQVREKAFYYLANVKKLTTPVCCDYICVMFVSNGELYNTSKITEINIIGNREVPTEYLAYNRYTTKLTFSDEITSIADEAIVYMDSLEEVIMPKNITNIGSKNFRGVKKDCNIVFDSTIYKSVPNNAAIVDLRTNTLICANEDTLIPSDVKVIDSYVFYNCGFTEFIVPEGVEVIKNNAFESCKNLEKLILPNTLKEIGDRCFYDAKKLKYIILPKTIEKIGNNLFLTYENKIYYSGSENDFMNVEFDPNNNISIYVKVYYYSEDVPTNDGNYWCYDEENVKEW